MPRTVHLKRAIEQKVEQSISARRRHRSAKAAKANSNKFFPSVRVTQDSLRAEQLQLSLTVDAGVTLSGLWCRIDGDWIDLGRLVEEPSAVLRQEDATRTYSGNLDLADIHQRIAPWIETYQEPVADSSEAAGFRFRIYVGVSAPLGRKPKYAANVEESDDELQYRMPIGRAAETDLSDFTALIVEGDRLTPYINKFGFLAVLVNEELPVFANIRNDGLEVKDGVLRIHGKVFTRNGKLTEGSLLLLGRTSGFRGSVPIELRYDEESTRRRFGLHRYYFSASYPFADDVASARVSDDTADIYLELAAPASDETFRRRVGKSRYLVRRHSFGSSVTRSGKTLSVTPYYTFKAKNPSLYLELFDADVYKHLERKLSQTGRSINSGKRKPVWIIGELPYKAQDNGLHFFRYMRDHHREIDAYYVIRSDSPERRNLDGYDHVLEYRSIAHVDKVLEADRVIGTHHPGFLYPIRTPEFERRVKAERIFLQHGVTGAKWMVPNYGKTVSDFQTDLILVCSEREKEFFVNDFGYSPMQVAVTGFTRFDALFAGDVVKQDNQILIMPTWRPWLQDPDFFTESEYYRRWTELLHSGELRNLQQKFGANIVFCLHPNMQQFSKYFSGPDIRVVIQGEVDVQHLMKESAAMVTDYSSVAFDFAFLDRPVIYYQFDAERFAVPHADPLTELPGPVVADENSLLRELRRVLENGSQMEADYHDRASKFIAHREGSNNERAFQAISELKVQRSLLKHALESEIVSVGTRVARRQKKYLPFMKALYRLFRLLPLNENVIVFESGQGRQFGDSPRAIYEELVRRGDTRKKVWIYSKALPTRDDHTVVYKRHSPGFFWHLATAKFWVNNHNFPHYIHRRRRGVYIQTWHGTPLKRMFLDQENFFGRDEGYKQRVMTATAQWNVLLSPSPYATKAMRSSYAYRGPVYELGYPRNDVLVGDTAPDVRASVRQRLGISATTRVVLYAPTFRDDEPTKQGRFAFDWPFDPVRFHERFGENTLMLVRTHVLVSSKLSIPDEARESVLDVSGYPDIQELFLASDMLVTDYSSSFFDYSILGRPMAFYAYDLENYRDNLRGFYLDYDNELPGPVVQTEEELFSAIEESRVLSQAQQETIRRFAERFAPRDDGHAAKRVVDELL